MEYWLAGELGFEPRLTESRVRKSILTGTATSRHDPQKSNNSLICLRRNPTVEVTDANSGDTRIELQEDCGPMRGKITKRAVDALALKKGTEVVLWDQEVRGFGIRARAGGAKTYILHYRAGTGRRAPLCKLTIGKHGSPWTPNKARTEAKKLLGLIASGENPAERRATERKALTVAELCDLYLGEGATHKKPSTLKADLGRIVHHIKPLLGQVRVDKVARADVERLLIDVKAGKTAAPKPNEDERRPGKSPRAAAASRPSV